MRKGLFIGINDYTHISRLSGCSNDAMAMASVLKTDADGDPNFKNVVLTSAEDYLGREMLEDQIRELFSGDCNVALLYFAGHGGFDTDNDEGMLLPRIIATPRTASASATSSTGRAKPRASRTK